MPNIDMNSFHLSISRKLCVSPSQIRTINRQTFQVHILPIHDLSQIVYILQTEHLYQRLARNSPTKPTIQFGQKDRTQTKKNTDPYHPSFYSMCHPDRPIDILSE